MHACYVRGNGGQPPRTGTDTWDKNQGYRLAPPQREHWTRPSRMYRIKTPALKMDTNLTWQMGEESPLTSPEMMAFTSTFFSLHHRQRANSELQNLGSFLKQDVCLRPPSPQINNPQNLISGGRVEALKSHYFHIPYPGALGLLRECGRPGIGKTLDCGGKLKTCASLRGEMSPDCITVG